jgi:hypothetical protein
MLSALAFAAGFAGLAIAAFARHPIYGVFLYLATFYVHPPSRWWSGWLPDLRWALLAAAVAIGATSLHRRTEGDRRGSWLATVPALVLTLYTAWMWVQALWALDSKAHFEATVQMTKYLVAYYLIWRVADTPQRLTDVLLFHVLGCFYLGWVAFNVGLSDGSRLNGVGGPGIDDANSLAMFLGTGAAVGAALLLQVTGWRRWVCIAAIAFILNGMILAGSRGAFLGLIAGGAVLFLLRPPEKRWLFWVFAVVGVASVVSLMDTRFIERMFTVKQAVEDPSAIDGSAENRIVLMEAQLRMFQSYPFGSGHKGTAALSPQYLEEKWLTRRRDDEPMGRSSHNTFLTTLVEQGIVGAALYGWLSLWGLMTVFRLKLMQWQSVPFQVRSPAMACCAAIAVVWVAGLFTDYLLAEVQVWLFALLASALALARVTVREAGMSGAPIGGPVASR